MLDEIEKCTILFWQEPDELSGEQAIVLKRWRGVIEMKQGKNEILISDWVVDEFIKAIRLCAKIVVE